MEITLAQLSAYLPYGLTGIFTHKNSDSIYEVTELTINKGNPNYDDNIDVTGTMGPAKWETADVASFKPFLLPLGDFNNSGADKEIFETGKYYTSVKLNSPEHLPQWEFQILCKHHFDVFGLIDSGLAIDIKTLKK